MKLTGLSARANQLSLMACRNQPIRDRVPSDFLTLTANLSPGRGLTSPLLATVGCLEITRKGQSLMSTPSLHDGTLIGLTFRSPRGRVVHDYPLSQTTTIVGCSAAPTQQKDYSSWACGLFTSLPGRVGRVTGLSPKYPASPFTWWRQIGLNPTWPRGGARAFRLWRPGEKFPLCRYGKALIPARPKLSRNSTVGKKHSNYVRSPSPTHSLVPQSGLGWNFVSLGGGVETVYFVLWEGVLAGPQPCHAWRTALHNT